MKKTALIAIIVFMLSTAGIHAAGGEELAFLKLGVGTRATGMGCAYTSIADDASASYYNPAGIVNLNGFELMGETYLLSFGRSLNYIATAKPFIVNGVMYAVGLSWINYSAGADIEARLTNSTQPDELISDTTHIFIFNAATKLSEAISMGGNFRVIINNFGAYSGMGVGFDLGAIVHIIKNMNAGISFTGISTNINWNGSTHTETVPQVAAAGLSYKFVDLFGAVGLCALPSVDIVYNSFNGFKARAGAEFSMNDFIFVRAGYNNALTLGAGLILKPSQMFSVKMDYAFTSDNMEPGASNHRIGLSVVYVFPKSGVEHNSKTDLKQPENTQDIPGITKKEVKDDYEW